MNVVLTLTLSATVAEPQEAKLQLKLFTDKQAKISSTEGLFFTEFHVYAHKMLFL